MEYNREGLRTNLHYQNIGRKQLISQLTPNIQRLYAAMQEVQTALAPKLTEDKAPKAAQQQQNQQQSQQQQQRRKVKPGQLVLNSNDELAMTASKKRSNAYARVRAQQQQQQPHPSKQQVAESQQRKIQAAQQQQQQQLLNEWLARGLVNLSLQVSQLQELLPPAADDSDGLPAGICGSGSGSTAAGSTPAAADAAAGQAAAPAAGSGDICSASDAAGSHLVLQLLESSSPAVQLQAATALEKACADADNAHCLATLGAAPRLVTLLSCGSAALQTVAANVLKQLAGTNPILKEAVVAAGGVRALAHLLCAGTDAETGTAAAAALGCIAAGSSVHKKTIAAMPSAINGLVGLLHSGETAAVEAATGTLRSLSSADAGTRVDACLAV